MIVSLPLTFIHIFMLGYIVAGFSSFGKYFIVTDPIRSMQAETV